MLTYLIAILGLGALCGVWVYLQQLLGRLDTEPDDETPRTSCGGCSGCNLSRDEEANRS